jgi:hypothetical protein
MKTLAVCVFVLFSVSAQAGMIFNTGAGDGFTSRPAGGTYQGVGTPVSVSTATTLTNIAMDLSMPNGGNIEYMIWDGTDVNLLFTTAAEAVTPGSTLTFVQSPNFSFSLVAGDTYYFGVISDAVIDGNLNVSYFSLDNTFTQNGLASLCCNSNYDNFASPTPDAPGGATMALQLFGTQTTTPEPATFGMIGAALSLLGLSRLRRNR